MTKLEEEYKKLVRKRLAVKRVTGRMWHNTWDILGRNNRVKFANLKFPTNKRKHKASPSYRTAPPTSPAKKVTPHSSLNTTPVKVALKKTNVCVLGQGAYGKACVRETLTGVKYVVKTSLDMNTNEIIRERNIHIKLYYGLPTQLRKYFPRPVMVKDEPESYAMTMFDGTTLWQALQSRKSHEYKRKVIRQLRKAIFALWTSGYIHGDMHSENIMVSRDQENPTIQILDFGMMRKSQFNVPNHRFKLNSVDYTNLSKNWERWFANSWAVQLNNLRLTAANPNMIVFPKKMRGLEYYARKHSGKIFNNLNASGKMLTPKKVRTDVVTKARIDKYKRLVRQRMGVKRVTKQAQAALWSKLSNKTKSQFGAWKPDGVVKHRTTPPKPTSNNGFRAIKSKPVKAKAPTPPTLDQQVARDFVKAGGRIVTDESLLRFWMTHYTTTQKKALYKKVRDPENAKKDYPICK